MTAEITTIWSVVSMDRRTSDGMVQTIHYTVDSKDDIYSAGAYGSIGLDEADPESMVAYSEITPETAVEWVKAKLGDEAIENIETALAAQLEEQRNPSKASGVPW